MLDLAKVAAAIARAESELWGDISTVHALVTSTWDTIKDDPLFAYRVAAVAYSPWALPSWHESLATIVPLVPYKESYTIISSDGSQIYPDRHTGISCGLINIGTVVIPYRNAGHGVILKNEPILILPEQHIDTISPIDMITIKRQEYEFKEAVAAAMGNMPSSRAVLFDGSLIFWHLQSIVGYEAIVQNYGTIMAPLAAAEIPYGSYISAPKSKELLNLVRLQLCNFNPANEAEYAAINQCTDSTIMAHHLPVGHRSIFFKSSSPVTALYPQTQQPYFCYLNHGAEIGRLELPAWLIQNEMLCEQFMCVVYDQIEKGKGYPIALAEAHEQAVIKGPDRELFFALLAQAGLRHNRFVYASHKQRHKNKPAV